MFRISDVQNALEDLLIPEIKVNRITEKLRIPFPTFIFASKLLLYHDIFSFNFGLSDPHIKGQGSITGWEELEHCWHNQVR